MRAGRQLARIMFTSLSILMWTAVGCVTTSHAACVDPLSVARIHLKYRYEFKNGTEREMAMSDDGIRTPVWVGLREFFPGLTFYHFLTDFTAQNYALIVVFEDCGVMVIEDSDAVGLLLRRSEPEISNRSDGEKFVRLLVKMIHSSQVLGDGYRDGDGIIGSVDDIFFSSGSEREELEKTVKVSAPTLKLNGEEFSYHYFSWHGKTTLALSENTLTWQRGGEFRYLRKVLKHDVGRPVTSK